ncbi:MAG: hypothetical protein AB7V46_14220 [Thermomicrobiales bacterium]
MKLRMLIATAAFCLGDPALAASVDLTCINDSGARWNITLDEDRGSATIVRLPANETRSGAPAVFTANEVRIDATGPYRGSQILLVINRTTLVMQVYVGVTALGPPRMIGTSQCEIVDTTQRRF